MIILKVSFIIIALIASIRFISSIYNYGKEPFRNFAFKTFEFIMVILLAYGIGQVI